MGPESSSGDAKQSGAAGEQDEPSSSSAAAASSSIPTTNSTTPKLRYVGFCGADDSVHPNQLALISRAYPWVEWGVLFRPDKEGQPRYATTEWRNRLGAVAALNPDMNLAAHLCGSHVNHLLSSGDDADDDGSSSVISAFLSSLAPSGFRRVQINATAVNGVDTSEMESKVTYLAEAIGQHPELEFIIQRNDETRRLWETMLDREAGGYGPKGGLPGNVVLLADESKGTGVRGTSWPSPPPTCGMGYAGGIGPTNVASVLDEVIAAAGAGREFWIDMESGVRSSRDGEDAFDLDKCYRCIDQVCKTGLKSHPKNLL